MSKIGKPVEAKCRLLVALGWGRGGEGAGEGWSLENMGMSARGCRISAGVMKMF